jgi:D-glycerate 3-kinase
MCLQPDRTISRFIDRYLPGYIFFGGGPISGSGDQRHDKMPPWLGNGLKIIVDQNREPVGEEAF